ncbi:hypothetical protein OSB04_027898 [Centaurea solstitialis]|uniref:FAR1 domain-containing protein n=1 Tax=Centaurea solstitialis TaxID=347529 RepID=A0AA38SY83_9ASTR|nr:hypothetical protein OSB04_027898 [Centaurea solstitialis]
MVFCILKFNQGFMHLEGLIESQSDGRFNQRFSVSDRRFDQWFSTSQFDKRSRYCISTKDFCISKTINNFYHDVKLDSKLGHANPSSERVKRAGYTVGSRYNFVEHLLPFTNQLLFHWACVLDALPLTAAQGRHCRPALGVKSGHGGLSRLSCVKPCVLAFKNMKMELRPTSTHPDPQPDPLQLLRFILRFTHYREKMDEMDDYSDLHLIEKFIEEGFEEDQADSDDDASAVAEVLHTPRVTIQAERTETFVSPGGTKYWIPYVSDDVKLSVGDGFPSSEAADIAYRKYADEAGFDVRQSNRKNKYDIVQTRYLLCSRQGFSEKKTMILWILMLQNGRTSCKACIKFRFRKEDRTFVVYKFEERHNHALYSNAEKRFSRGRRQLQYTDYLNMYNATGSSIGGSKAHNIQSALRGGVENVSTSVVDYKNASRDMIAFVGNKDAQMLINLMTR